MPDGTSRFSYNGRMVHHHWRCRCRPGDFNATFSAGDRPRLAGHRLWWRQGPDGFAQDCRLVHGRLDEGLIEIDPMFTHELKLEDINKAFDLMHKGESIRSVVVY